jgi:hypothetical protein
VKVKMLIGIAGRWEPQAGSVYIDVKRGDVVDIPEEAAYRHAAHGRASSTGKPNLASPAGSLKAAVPAAAFTLRHRDIGTSADGGHLDSPHNGCQVVHRTRAWLG